MNIVCISGELAGPLRAAGHNIPDLRPASGAHSLASLLPGKNFKPELVFQDESLGPRLLLTDLPDFDCPKIFRSLDSHLNLFWHRHYGRLFDTVLTPHVSLHEREAPAWKLPYVGRLAISGAARPFRSHADRMHALSFVGRLSGDRHARRNLLRLLAPFGLNPRDGLTKQAMLELYDDTRILPNESLCNEVNFRLMEGASCGCCLLTPDVGADQDALLEPGRECFVYHDGAELLELLQYALSNPVETEHIGRAAWMRVQAEHLPQHRMRVLLKAARDSGRAATGEEARAHLVLSMARLVRAGLFHEDPGATDARLRALPLRPDLLAARVQAASEHNNTALLSDVLRETLVSGFGAGDAGLDGICSFAALTLQDWALAKRFLYRYHQARATEQARVARSPHDLCLIWAREYLRLGREAQPGLPFTSGTCPESALEALLFAERFAEGEDNRERLQLLAGLESVKRVYPALRIKALSALCAERPEDRHSALHLALARFHNFEPAEGERALINAWNRACIARQDQDFLAALRRSPAVLRTFATLTRHA